MAARTSRAARETTNTHETLLDPPRGARGRGPLPPRVPARGRGGLRLRRPGHRGRGRTHRRRERGPGRCRGSGSGSSRVRSRAAEIDRAVIVRGETEATREVDVRAETSGQVVSAPLRRGASVEEGQLLCEIDPGSREVQLIEAEARLLQARAGVPESEARLAEARARLEEAEIADRAATQLVEQGFASQTRVAGARAGVESARAGVQSALAGLEAAQAAVRSGEAAVAASRNELDRLRITAPFAGLLESDTAELGSLLQPGALCATVIQLDPMKLVGFVSEAAVDRIEVGAMAGGRLVGGGEVTGRVTFLSRAADPTTRTFRVEVEVPNPDLAIRDGQTPRSPSPPTAPRASLPLGADAE
jgi:membrane fusion protein, multidrug efflux system